MVELVLVKLTLADQLGEGDALDLWEFDNQPRHIGSTMEGIRTGILAALGQRTPHKRMAALISQLSGPAGGTEIGASLSTTIAKSQAHDILLITDGKSHALDVQALARMGRRISVVLIGEDSLEANVGHLAALTGGDIFVAAGDRIGEILQAAVGAFRSRVEAPDCVVTYPDRIRVTRGNALITAEWRQSSEPVGEIKQSVFARAIAALAASLALPGLETETATRLAEAEGLVTHLTSLALVDEDAKTQEGMPATRKVALATPRTNTMFCRKAGEAMAPILTSLMINADEPRASIRCLASEAPISDMLPPPTIILDLSRLPKSIDWDIEPNRLLAGDLSGLDRTTRELIEQATRLDLVKEAAGRWQIAPTLVVLALIAGTCADRNRSAGRLRRAILKGKPSREIDDVARALGLGSGRTRLLKRFLQI